MIAMAYNNDQHIFNVPERYSSTNDQESVTLSEQSSIAGTSAGSWPRSALPESSLSDYYPWQTSVSRQTNVARSNHAQACQSHQLGEEFCSCALAYTSDSSSSTSVAGTVTGHDPTHGRDPSMVLAGLPSAAHHDGLFSGLPIAEHVGDASANHSVAFGGGMSASSTASGVGVHPSISTAHQHQHHSYQHHHSPSMSPSTTYMSSSPGWRQPSLSWTPEATMLVHPSNAPNNGNNNDRTTTQTTSSYAQLANWPDGGAITSSPLSLPASAVPIADNALGMNFASYPNAGDRRFSLAASTGTVSTPTSQRSSHAHASIAAQRRVSLPYQLHARGTVDEELNSQSSSMRLHTDEGKRSSSTGSSLASVALTMTPASSHQSDQAMLRSTSAQTWQPMRLDLSSLTNVSERQGSEDARKPQSQAQTNLLHFGSGAPAPAPMSFGHRVGLSASRQRPQATSSWSSDATHIEAHGWDSRPSPLYFRGIPGFMDEGDSSPSNASTSVATPTQASTSTSNRFTVSIPNAGVETGAGATRGSFRDLTTEEGRWAAMLARSHAADQVFLYGAQTTKIVCKPSCASKRPDRNRVRYFLNPGAAEAAIREGYRPCKRCKPHLPGSSDQCVAAVGACVRHITRSAFAGAADSDLKRRTLKEYAAMARLSPFHFHRTFKAVSSVTPGEYAKACHTLALQDALGIDNHGKSSGLDAISIASVLSSWSIRRARRAVGGISPAAYSAGCMELDMAYTVAWTAFGKVAIAYTEDTLYATLLRTDAEERIQRRFPGATRRDDRSSWLTGLVEDLAAASDREVQLPVDVHYSVRRARIWIAVTRYLAGGSGSEEEE